MGKTPEYVRNAIKKYESKFDKKTVNFPKGTSERVAQLTGQNFSSYVIRLVLADLERLEANSAQEQGKQLYSDYTKSETVEPEPQQPDILQDDFPVEENVCPF